MANRHVLIVGAGGYIGEGVACAFRRAGYIVYGAVRPNNIARIRPHLEKNEIITIEGDLANPEQLTEYIKKSSIIIDAVYSPKTSPGFFDHVKALKAGDPDALFILTSGIMLYYNGEFQAHAGPRLEEQEVKPVDPEEMIPKRKFEEYVLGSKEISTSVIRPGFVYGGSGGVIWSLFFDVNRANQKLEILGRPDKIWSWVHVDDLGDGYVKVAQEKQGKADYHELYNLSVQDNPTYAELKVAAAKVAGWQGSADDLDIKPVPADRPRLHNWETVVIIDPRKAKTRLGWDPKHTSVLRDLDIYYLAYKAHQQR